MDRKVEKSVRPLVQLVLNLCIKSLQNVCLLPNISLLIQTKGGDVMGGTCSTYAGNESCVEMYVIKYGGKRQFRRRRIILKFMPILDDRM